MKRTAIIGTKGAAIIGTVLAACLLVAGCGSSSKPGTAGPPTSPATTSAGAPTSAAAPTTGKPSAAAATITIKDFGYTMSGPAAPGAKVSVSNNDDTAHTVTADSAGGFDVTVQPGKTATFTAPAKAGKYKFHCTFHSNMHGTLTVS